MSQETYCDECVNSGRLRFCPMCEKELSKEKGEFIYGCLDCHHCVKADKIEKLQAENEKLRECVEFYSDIDIQAVVVRDKVKGVFVTSEKHQGKRARSCLKEITETEDGNE